MSEFGWGYDKPEDRAWAYIQAGGKGWRASAESGVDTGYYHLHTDRYTRVGPGGEGLIISVPDQAAVEKQKAAEHRAEVEKGRNTPGSRYYDPRWQQRQAEAASAALWDRLRDTPEHGTVSRLEALHTPAELDISGVLNWKHVKRADQSGGFPLANDVEYLRFGNGKSMAGSPASWGRGACESGRSAAQYHDRVALELRAVASLFGDLPGISKLVDQSWANLQRLFATPTTFEAEHARRKSALISSLKALSTGLEPCWKDRALGIGRKSASAPSPAVEPPVLATKAARAIAVRQTYNDLVRALFAEKHLVSEAEAVELGRSRGITDADLAKLIYADALEERLGNPGSTDCLEHAYQGFILKDELANRLRTRQERAQAVVSLYFALAGGDPKSAAEVGRLAGTTGIACQEVVEQVAAFAKKKAFRGIDSVGRLHEAFESYISNGTQPPAAPAEGAGA